VDFDQVVEALEEKFNTELTQETPEVLALLFDDIAVDIHEEEQALCIESALYGLPTNAEERESLYHDLLCAAGAGAMEYGASVYIDLPSNQVLLRQLYPLNRLTFSKLDALLESFVSGVEYYNNAL